MKILGINISHHASSCLIEDGNVLYFLEEERISRIKEHCYLFNGECAFFIDRLKSFTTHVDYVIFSSFGREIGGGSDKYDQYDQDPDKYLVDKLVNQIKESGVSIGEVVFQKNEHHLYHASNAFYGSGFDDAVCLIMDGGGALYGGDDLYRLTGKENSRYREIETYYEFSYDKEPKSLHKHYSLESDYDIPHVYKNENNVFSTTRSNGGLFNILGSVLGFDSGRDAGKVMGLSSYAKNDRHDVVGWYEEIDWFIEKDGEWITSPEVKMENFEDKRPFKKFSFEESDLRLKANLAKKLQDETLKHTNKLIEKALKLSNSRNIVLSGGYSLNCVNNFKYLQELPSDVNIFIDPISNDSGTSMGAAKYLWYKLSGSKDKKPLKNLFLG
jgi:carbamoyltransferase